MNEVINRIEERIDLYQSGSIYVSRDKNKMKYYMLTMNLYPNKEWNTICLNDGTYWAYGIPNALDAVDGLDFVSNNYKIILENK